MVKKWVYSSFLYLLIISLLGILLRWKMVEPVWPELSFMHVVHAHSHVAFLGWVYILINAVFIQHCFPAGFSKRRAMKIYYFLLHVSVIGMLFSFSYQGYGLISIGFSTLHAFLSYYFAYQFFIHRNTHPKGIVHSYYQAAVWFNLLSSLGPWGLAIAGATGLGNETINNFFIYYYLHLQYNGWFTFVIIGIIYHLLASERNLQYSWVKWQFGLLAVSVIPSYLSSALWLLSQPIFVAIGLIGSFLQFISISMLLMMTAKLLWKRERSFSLRFLLSVSLASLGVKSLLELMGAWPLLAYAIYDSRQVIIAYLHLTLLGFITTFLMYFSGKEYAQSKITGPYVAFYLLGVVSMIILLFLAGLLQWMQWPLPKGIWMFLLGTGILTTLGIVGFFIDIHRGFRASN